MLLLVAAPTFGQRYQAEVYNLKEGLPQSQVDCLLEDHRGYIWVGTQGGGLARFDGRNFEVLNSSHGLPGNKISALAEINQTLYIGTDDGLALYNGLEVTTGNDEPMRQAVYAIAESDKSLFVAAGDELYFIPDASQPFEGWESILQDETIFDLLVTQSGELYACGDGGVYYINKESHQVSQLSFSGSAYCNALFEDGEQVIKACTYGNGMLRVDQGELLSDRSYGRLPRIVLDGLQSDRGETFLATQRDGLIIHTREGEQEVYDQQSGLPINHIRCLLEDRWGNIWIGSSGSGLIRLSALPFTHYSSDTGLRKPQVYAVTSAPDQGIIFSNGDVGSYLFRNDSLIKGPFEQGTIKTLFTDSRGWVWAGYDGSGIEVMTPDTLFFIDGDDGLSSPFVRAFAEGPDGSIWVGTAGGGITRIFNPITPEGRINTRIYTSGNGLSEDRITDLVFDDQNRLWYSTRSHGFGVILSKGDILNFGKDQGLQNEEVRSIIIDSYGVLWIGSGNGQISRLDLNKEVYAIEQLDIPGERPYALYAMDFDSRENLWLGSANGAWQLTLNAEREVISTEKFDIDEGFNGLEVCANAILSDNQGVMWFGTVDGLSMHFPLQKTEALIAPRVFLEHPELDLQPLRELPQHIYLQAWDQPTDTMVFTYEQNDLSFEIGAIHLKYPDDLTFSYWLEGYTDEWSTPSTRSLISLGNLPPGNFTLHYKSCVKGLFCNEGRPITIKILRPFWQKSWFFGALLLGGFILVSLSFYFFVQGVKRRAKIRSERLRLERDALEMEQKALRLQMNPHFIFNSLNSIQGLIAKEDNRSARLYLSRFSRLMREILENSREDMIPLEEELKTLEHYLDMERFTHGEAFTYEIEAPDDLLHLPVPPLVIQPFVENSIIHGLLPKGEGAHLSVEVTENEAEDLLIIVEDNGIGRAASSLRNAEREGHRSAGLSVTEERLSMLSNGENELTFISFEDLYVEGNASGTRVTIRIPNPDE
ncbi:two-component regulator propeller domain-containing protein [Sanyastnella coralliicola]|uniref:two-component regulator propeller domain-containing protein n=1 Tax=Sanyastnella coralliicola TaxID=3069118 RepID=UPI0027BB016D|nr:two-component regulator propeller domain-containing protein [Longitalea sp. SCSIO 12813]